MANTLLTPSEITREALRILHNNLGYVKGLNREYDSQFANTGGKIGQTMNIRKPAQFYVRKGKTAAPQGFSETYVPLTLSTQWGVDVSFSTAELTMSLDDFGKRVLTPQMAKLASQIDMDCLQAAVTGWFYGNDNTLVNANAPAAWTVGTAGTTPGTGGGAATGIAQYNAPIVYLNAGRILDDMAVPRDGSRSCGLNPAAHAQSVSSLSGLFNPQGIISEQYRKGLMGDALDLQFYMDQNIYTLTTGSAAIGNITLTSGAATAVSDTVTGTLQPGQVFTVASVYAVNPENQKNTGLLQHFVITPNTRTSDGSYDLSVVADRTLNIWPTPVNAAAGVANGTVTGMTSGVGAVGTLVMAANTVTPQNLVYHKDFATFGTVDLMMPNGVDFAARETYDGISMRLIRQYDVRSDDLICRIDVLGGYANLRPELAVKIAG